MKISVLITAYAVNPFKGSEDGTGWNIIRALSEEQVITAITRRNNQPDIEQYLASHPEEKERLNFAYYDLPKWLSWWKKGSRGALIYHYLWHLGVVFFILRKAFSYDLVHHLNFHSDWNPSFLWLLGKPFIWGPVGHHPMIPQAYQSTSQALQERIKFLFKQLAWRFDPFLWLTKKKAAGILAINSSVARALRLSPEQVYLVPAIAAQTAGYRTERARDSFRVLSIGRFIPLKGFDMVISAFAHFYHQLAPGDQEKCQLTLIGQGPEEAKLRHQALQERLPTERIRFINWVPQSELIDYWAQADLFFFPSHEGAGMVIPEAMANELPILCYDNVGPGETIGDTGGGIRIPYSNEQESKRAFSQALWELFSQPHLRKRMGQAAYERFINNYTWRKKADQIQQIYQQH